MCDLLHGPDLVKPQWQQLGAGASFHWEPPGGILMLVYGISVVCEGERSVPKLLSTTDPY